MHDTGRPLPRRIPTPRHLATFGGTPANPRPLTARAARGTAGASARAEAARLRAEHDQIADRQRYSKTIVIIVVLLNLGLDLISRKPGSMLPFGIATAVYLGGVALITWRRRRKMRRLRTTADRWAQGAAGEESTGRILAPLLTEGWHILHDRTIRGSQANLDHVLITPDGRSIIVLDSKSWQRRSAPVTAVAGRLYYGAQDQITTLNTLLWEAGRVTLDVGRDVTVHPVIAVHGARVDHSPIHAGTVTIASANNLLDVLRTFTAGYKGGGAANTRLSKQVADRVALMFPAYNTTR